MSIKQKDIKILWGRSGNRCAICQTELTQDKKAESATYTLGEQAHIVGETEESPRGKSRLTKDQRDSYHNLILLCPTHHREIDSNVEDWPIEKLHQIKSEHELWVTETLSETIDHVKLARQVALGSLVDGAVSLCKLDEWKEWTSYALSPDPEWPMGFKKDIFEFRQKVVAAIWPEGFDELKKAIQTFSILLHRASQKFSEHSEIRNGRICADKFYKTSGWNENYDRDLAKYNLWDDDCRRLTKESTKAANWLADEVRKNINPLFFVEKGKFMIVDGPYMDLSFRAELLEYTEEEKKLLPDILTRINEESI